MSDVPHTFVAIDFETADNGRDSACAVGVVRVEAGEVVAGEARLIRPPRRRFLHTWVHGIRWADVADAPTFGEVWPGLLPLLDGAEALVAHNASFDRSVLHACCEAAALPPPPLPFVCTVQVARRRWNLRPARLPDVCAHVGVPLHNHHDALADAEACARIAIHAWREAAGA